VDAEVEAYGSQIEKLYLDEKKSYSEASCELEVTKCLFECLIYISVFRIMIIIT